MENSATSQAAARYSRVAIAFHWLLAVLIMLNYAGAWYADGLPKAEKMQVMGNHKAFGITILILSVLRIVWALAHRAPPLAETLKAWEVALARVVHGLIYFLTIAIPAAGWAMHSAATGGMPVSFFGLFSYPGLPMAQDKANMGLFFDLHGLLATLLLALMGLHVIAALKHQFLDRDNSMRRILPWGK
jgi:cytochrome b561